MPRNQIGHNGGPALDEPAPIHQPLPQGAACSRCQHWTAPSAREQSDYDFWKMTGKGRRIKEPTGSCHRVRLRANGPTGFAATSARSSCYNYEDDTRERSTEPARGFMTIYQDGKIAWQGREGDEPAEFRQGELDL